MIVCLCEAITDREILSHIQDGALTIDDVSDACRAGSDCRQCRSMIRMLLRSHCTGDTSACSVEREAEPMAS